MSTPELSGTIVDNESAMPTASSRSTATVAFVLSIFGGAFAALWSTTESLIGRWNDTDGKTYTHGYLIVLISAWLLWRERHRFSAAASRRFWPALFAVLATSGVWLLSLRSGIQTGHQVLLPVLIWLAIAGALGWRAALVSTFAIGYLYFAIPVWGSVNSILQSLTTQIVGWMLHATGVVASIEGNFIHLPVGTFEIAAGCSGIHFFIVALAIAALYGEIHRDSTKVRIQLLVLAAVVAAVTNWIRVYVIVVAGYLTDMQHYLVRVEHYRFGWAVFVVTMTVFMLIARRLPSNDSSADVAVVTEQSPAPIRMCLAALAAVALMAVGPTWNYVMSAQTAQIPGENVLLPAVSSAGSHGPLPPVRYNWMPQFHGVDDALHARYTVDGRDVELFTAVYASQRQDKELVAYDNSIFGAERVQIVNESIAGEWHELEISTAGKGHELVRYQYMIGTTRTSNDLRAQLSYGLYSFAGTPLSRLIALRTDCAPDCESARERMIALAQTLNRNEANHPTEGRQQ